MGSGISVELWRDIADYPNYSVSNLGRVRSRFGRGRILKPGTTTRGYLQVVLWANGNKKRCLIHRLVAEAFLQNHENKPYVDHVDGVHTHNFATNLRWCTNSENNMNQKSHAGSSSSFKGVCWDKKNNKWQAQIRIDGKQRYLGLFTDEEDAARAYDDAARELFGEFARPNFPSSDSE